MTVINVLAFCFSFTLILCSFLKISTWLSIKVLLITLLLAIGALFLKLEAYTMFPVCINAALYLYIKTGRKKGKLANYFFSAFCTCLAQFIIVGLVGTLLIFLDPSLHKSNPYDLMVAFSLVFFGGILKYFMTEPFLIFKKANVFKMSIISGFFVLAISVMMPIALMMGTVMEQRFLYYVVFALSLLVIFWVFYHLAAQKSENEKIRQNSLSNMANQEMLLHTYNEYLSYKHFYHKLYENIGAYLLKKDIDGLISYFASYVTPVHKELIPHTSEIDAIDKIKNTLIHDLILNTVLRIQYIHEKQINILIEQMIYIKSVNEFTLFKILSVFIDNATEEIETQPNGYMEIVFKVIEGNTHIYIKNSLADKDNIDMLLINTPGYSKKKGHMGQGLKLASQWIKSNEAIQHLNYMDKQLFIQHLIIGDG